MALTSLFKGCLPSLKSIKKIFKNKLKLIMRQAFTLAAVGVLAELAKAAIVADGLWTGNDWYDSVYNIGVVNGVPYSNDPFEQRRITAPLTIDGPVDSIYLDRENVQRVMSIFSAADWTAGFPQADPIYTYDNFLRAVAKFPSFCGETNIAGQTVEQTCRRELASIFAHWG